jgi:putative phosphoribosyl transferase
MLFEGTEMKFKDRTAAGQWLADRLSAYTKRPDVLVLALPGGGIAVAAEVAAALGAPLDVFLVRQVGVPRHEDLAMGAVASGGVRILNEDVIEFLGLSSRDVEEATARERDELERSERRYRRGLRPLDPRGKIVLLIDDGLADGSTLRAAVNALRKLGPWYIVVAVPVAPPSKHRELSKFADDVVCVVTPNRFDDAGRFYRNFPRTTDEELCAILERATTRTSVPTPGGMP